ncbi:MAG: DHHW family protein [Clostridiaceae bacterium]|nr:DHHW family protein [Clostridiaceae bacterium]
MKAKAKTAVFLAVVIFLSALFLMLPKRGYSDNESRYLAALPDFSFEALLNGTFSPDFENYVTDAFPLRDMWISIKSRLDLAAGRKDTGGVYVTDDGSLIEMFDSVDEERYSKNLDYLRKAYEMYAERLSSFDVMLVPTASEVQAYKIGGCTADINQRELLEQASDVISVDCLGALEDKNDEYIYYSTDHHWTSIGAYYCYVALMGDRALPLDNFKHEVLSEEFLGTTFSKAGLYFRKDVIDAYSIDGITFEHNMSGEKSEGIYDKGYLQKKDKYSVFLGGNQPLTVIRTRSEGGRLLLVKDSYANTFVQFLTPHYSEIHVIDLRSFGMSLSLYAEENGITDMLVLYNLKGFSEEGSVFRITK